MNIDVEVIASQLGIPSQHIPMLINAFLEESKGILQELESSIDSKNYSDIGLHAHSIKGSSANLRINEVADIAVTLEQAGKASDTGFDYTTAFTNLQKSINSITV